MKFYNVIIFDLDGVLIDQSVTISKCAMLTLKKFEIVEKDNKRLLRFVGPTLKESFMKFYSFDEKKALDAAKYYRKIYEEKYVDKFKVYGGMKNLLSTLKKDGKKIFVATTKAKAFADIVLKHADLNSYFDKVYGDTLNFKNTKTSMVGLILKDIGKIDKSNVVMIGDRHYDIIAAKENNIDSIGVTYGFGSREELNKAGATYIVPSVKELKELLER